MKGMIKTTIYILLSMSCLFMADIYFCSTLFPDPLDLRWFGIVGVRIIYPILGLFFTSIGFISMLEGLTGDDES